MKKVLLISDKPNWAYAAIANAIIVNNDRNLILDHISCKKNIKKVRRLSRKYDCSFVLGWQNAQALNLDKKRTLVGIHSHQSFDNRETLPDHDVVPDRKVIDYLAEFRGVNTVSKRLQSLFAKSGLKTAYTPNGVDTDTFSPTGNPDGFVVASAGALKNDWNKGIRRIVSPVCRKSGISLIHATDLAYQKMPVFYNRAHCYVCASRSEGMSLSILEAAACGCVIISTRCGDIEQLITDGINGLFISRSKSSLSKALLKLRNDRELLALLSTRIRKLIEEKWSWKHQIKGWLDFIETSC